MTNAQTDRFIVAARISQNRTGIKAYRAALARTDITEEQRGFLVDMVATLEAGITETREELQRMW
jgi:hypothetical protein